MPGRRIVLMMAGVIKLKVGGGVENMDGSLLDSLDCIQVWELINKLRLCSRKGIGARGGR